MQEKNHQSATETNLGTTPISLTPLTAAIPVVGGLSGIIPQQGAIDDEKKELELRLKFAEETHQYVREYIRLADQKATFFFAGATALLAYLHKLELTNIWISNPKSWGLVEMLALVATLGLIFSTIGCLTTVVPRLKGSRRGLIFFAAISEYDTAAEYAADVMKQGQFTLCEAKLKHAYELSVVCKKKYVVLICGQWAGVAGVIATLMLLVIK